MASNTAKPVGLAAIVLVLWFGTYWMYEPAAKDPRITFGLPPVPTGMAESTTQSGGSEVSARSTGGLLGNPIAAAATGERRTNSNLTAATPTSVDPVRREPERAAPEPVSAGQPRVVAPVFTMYTVQRGDVSFEAIARRLGGGAKLADAIKRANPFVPPTKLVAGRTQLRIPSDPENVEGQVVVEQPRAVAKPAAEVPVPPAGAKWPMTEQSHTVVAGETLSGIAAKYYSAPMAWKKVFEANRDVMTAPEKVKVGATLRIPPGP